jgi:hypothetical protein
MKNNKERYKQIIDEVYENYLEKYKQDKTPGIVYYTDPLQYRPYTKEEFINKIKTGKKFSEIWELEIEERELSRQERYEHLRTHKYSGKWDGIGDAMEYYNSINVPTKLITVTYNNETIEVYVD